MGIGEVLEQQVPHARLFVPLRVEAARHEASRHCACDVRIERNLVAAARPRGARDALGLRGLEDQRLRGVRRITVVRETQPHDFREDRLARAFDGDFAHAALSQSAGAAQRVGQLACLQHTMPRPSSISMRTSVVPPGCRLGIAYGGV